MFHFSLDRKAMESVLMQDEKLCRNNMVISSQTKYVSEICRLVANTRIRRSHNQNNTIKQVAQLHFMNIHSQYITHLGKNHYTPNASTNNIYYCIKIMAALNTYYIPEFIRNLFPQFVLRVRDIFMQSYSSKLIKKIYLCTN